MKKNLFNTIKNMKNLRRTACYAVLAALLAGAAPVSTIAEEVEADAVVEKLKKPEDAKSEEEWAAQEGEAVQAEETAAHTDDAVQADADSNAANEDSVNAEEPAFEDASEEKSDEEDALADEENAGEDESEEDEDAEEDEEDEEDEEELESDPEADLESAAVWSRAILGVEYGDDYRENLIKAAITQLGYTESVLNFEVFEEEERNKGYTRYGDWYGDTYGDWCAMFVAFCLHYSGNDVMTVSSSCEEWKNKLIAEGRYHKARELFDEENPFELKPGDLIFFDNRENDGIADHIGIVEKVEKGYILTIEGNTSDMVSRRLYIERDHRILGFGEFYGPESLEEVPEIPELKIEAGSVMLKTDEYFVNISYEDYAGIPEGAEFTLIPVDEESSAYDGYMISPEGLIEIPEDENAQLKAKLFRVEIKKDDKIIAAKASVDVKIIFKSPLPYSLDEETYIMRYKGSDAEAMEIKGSIYGVNKKVQAVAFETENISAVQGVVYVENTERAQETEENE
ncbi:MAG: CHAP domain-containing protein [Firmicutes bacterium]|nr:CHAP domain-containing protein [Bacillota bacterium]